MKKLNPLCTLNISVFLQTQMFLLPVLFLFYRHCGLGTGDFFLFQGIFSLTALVFQTPAGYLGDVFSKRNILMLSYAFFIARLLLWLFFSQYGYWIILIGEILYAAQKATFAGVSDSYIYNYLKNYNIHQKMLKNYGKMNFFMSLGATISSLTGAWLYHLISSWSLQRYQQDFGFLFLICLELILNTIALYLLSLLPEISPTLGPKTSLKQLYIKFFKIISWTAKNKKIWYHMLYSGLLASITVVFVWSFQPMMKLLLIPVSIYGVIYFINHAVRALASLCSDKIMHFISLSKLALLILFMFSLSFIFSIAIINIQPLPVWINLGYFVFICLAIGVQLIFLLSHTSRFHRLIPSNTRATVSSVNVACGRLCAGFFLILLKVLIDGVSMECSFAVCFFIFIVAAPVLYKRLSNQGES